MSQYEETVGLIAIDAESGAKQRPSLLRRFAKYIVGLVIVIILFTVSMGAIFGLYFGIRALFMPRCIRSANPYRLTDIIRPHHYDVTISPDLSQFNYNGSVSIWMHVHEATSCIYLHAEDLNIYSSVLSFIPWDETSKMYTGDAYLIGSPEKTEADGTTRVMTLDYGMNLAKGMYRLSMTFNADLRNDLRGFYKAKYYDAVGKRDVWIGTTHMEPTSARTVFPCFDEPSFKATFNLTINLRSEDAARKAIANMPILAETKDEKSGARTVVFYQTPRMSTYLLAFVVGEFDYVETYAKFSSSSEYKILYRVFTPVNLSDRGYFALEVATRVTPFFSDFTAFDYFLPHLYLIAIPDFRAGAMENLGLLTFRDSAILVSASTTLSERKNVARVIAHEMAHYWFGDLVTCAYWSELFLNEGFARFFENMALENQWPEWAPFDAFVSTMMPGMLSVDSLPSTRPLVIEDSLVNTTPQISALFDTITYVKGASFLRLMRHDLGAQTFYKWMQDYIIAYFHHGLARTKDLFTIAKRQKYIDDEYEKRSMTWATQAGFPVVSVVREGASYKLSQKRFLSVAPDTPLTDQPTWWIPLTWMDASGAYGKVDMTGKEASFSSGAAYVKFNKGQTAPIRVNYDNSMWKTLTQAIEQGDEKLMNSVTDRFGLMDDAFALSLATETVVSNALDMSLALKSMEQTSTVWGGIVSSLTRLNQIVWNQAYYAAQFRQGFLSALVRNKFDEIGWDAQTGESEDRASLRVTLLSAYVKLAQNASVIEEAVRRFNAPGGVPVELRSSVYAAVMLSLTNADDPLYGAMIQRMLDADKNNDPNERNRCMLALGWVKVPALIQKSLDLSLTDDIRSQDGVSLIREVARSSSAGADAAWNFLKTKFDALIAKYGQRQVSSSLVPGVAGLFSTADKIQEVKTFFADKPQITADAVAQAVQSIGIGVNFLKASGQNLQDWLNQRFPAN